MNGDSPEINRIEAPRRPAQFARRQIFDPEVDTLIRIKQAQEGFKVSGAGLAVAVLDSGIRATHKDFKGRRIVQHNFTSDNDGDTGDASDGHGHGTHVTGIIAAKGVHTGIAFDAGIVALKVLQNDGEFEEGDPDGFGTINRALQWVLDHRQEFNITAINLSLGDVSNHVDLSAFQESQTRQLTRQLISQLRQANVPLITGAGNKYFRFRREGMCFPAILPETISVGAIFDAAIGKFTYLDGSIANTTQPGQITPFSQRLHEDNGSGSFTTIFAPGAPITSTGHKTDEGESLESGTSQAVPVITGVVLLMQEYYRKTTGKLPPVGVLAECLRSGGEAITDGDDEKDNVPHTNKQFQRVHALRALDAVRRHLQIELLRTETAFR